MNLMERMRRRRREREVRRFTGQSARLRFGVVDVPVVVDPSGVATDRVADPETVAARCPECELPVVDGGHMGEDGTRWHARCRLHAQLGCMGDSALAVACAVCDRPIVRP